MTIAHWAYLGLALVSCESSAQSRLTPNEVFRSASRSIVVVETFDSKKQPVGQGSGVVVARGVAVTNCHVFEGAVSAGILYQSERFDATLHKSNSSRDLCSLSIKNLTAPSVKFGSAVANDGMWEMVDRGGNLIAQWLQRSVWLPLASRVREDGSGA